MNSARPAELFQLDESTCLALLGVHHVGRLIVPGDDPYVIPLNYVASDGAVVVRTERRPVIEEVVGRFVVFEVDMYDDRTRSGWSVVVRGRARDVSAEIDVGAESSRAVPRTWVPGPRDFVIRIEPERVTGRLLRGALDPPSVDGRGYL
jgi:nitroimidazol reductase NimA-like FMN-containing flavoprotein (pyridoxamine 5'-phosphate oxidase superfamily)